MCEDFQSNSGAKAHWLQSAVTSRKDYLVDISTDIHFLQNCSWIRPAQEVESILVRKKIRMFHDCGFLAAN
jgi:hypothetical protein